MGASRSSLSCDPGRDVDDEETDVIDCVIAEDEEEEEEARLPTPPR